MNYLQQRWPQRAHMGESPGRMSHAHLKPINHEVDIISEYLWTRGVSRIEMSMGLQQTQYH